MITLLGEYPSLAIGPLLDSNQTDIEAIMRESLESEAKALAFYRELLKSVEGCSVILEEYARSMVYAEELHASEVDKMLRRPGEIASFRPSRQSSVAQCKERRRQRRPRLVIVGRYCCASCGDIVSNAKLQPPADEPCSQLGTACT